MKTLFAVIFILLFLSNPSSRVYACDDVWVEKVNIEALNRCKDKAIAGDTDAQFQYGLWLIRLPQEHKNIIGGLKWLEVSAINRHYYAQIALGRFYSGEPYSPEFPCNLIKSYAWYSTAHLHKSAATVEAKMTKEEKIKAKKLAEEYMANYLSEDVLIK